MADPSRHSTSTLAAPASPDVMATGSQAQEKQPFWSKDVKEERSFAAKTMLKGIVMITVVLWLALPIFWGSNYLLLRYFSQLTILGIDFESPVLPAGQAAVGPILTQMAQEMSVSPMRPHLGFALDVDSSSFPGGIDQVKEAVAHSKYWGAIVAYPNCTSTWQSSLQTGNASYDPTGCIGVFYNGARFYQISLLYLAPFMTRFANTVAQQASRQAATQYLNANTGNAGALALAAQVPQAIGTPFSFHQNDLRPINAWAVAAIFEASLIYYLIFSYILAVWGYTARQKYGWNQKLSFVHLVLWRLGIPFIFYFWLSLNYSLLFLAFKIPTNGAFGSGSGFMALWMLNWLCLLSLGLVLEGLITVLGPEFVPFTLIILIILNLTSSFQPIELMEKFYRFERWLPFYHTIEGYKIITHGTRAAHEIGLNYGVLIANIAVMASFLVVWMIVERKQEEKKMQNKSILYE